MCAFVLIAGRLKEKGDALEVECVNDKQGNGEKQEKGEAGKESGGVDGVTNHTGPKSAYLPFMSFVVLSNCLIFLLYPILL